MTNLIIIAVMISVLLGGAAYGVVSSTKALQTNIEKLIIEARLEEAVQGVLNNIVSTTTSSTQTYYVPAPDNLSSPAVPSWITANAQTPRGLKFLYCPFSNNSGAGSTITTPSSSYTATIGTLYTGSQNYITASTVGGGTRPTNASSALAIIVAPVANQASAPDCLNVTSGGTLAGAQVRIISEAEVQSRYQVTASMGSEFYGATSASGDSSGKNSSNPALFDDVMTYVAQYRPQVVKVNLAAGTYSVTSTNAGETGVSTREFSQVRNHSIYWNGASASSALLQYGSAGVLQPVFIGNVRFSNLGVPAVANNTYRPVATSLGSVYVDESTNMQFINAVNGKIFEFGNTTLSGGASGATGGWYASRGGDMYIGGNMTMPASAAFLNHLFIMDPPFGRAVFGSNSNLVGVGNSTYLWGYSTFGNEILALGNIYMNSGSGSLNWWTNYTGARMIFSGMQMTTLYQYNLVLNLGIVAMDRGTTVSVNNTQTLRPVYAYPASETYLTNVSIGASARPANSAIIVNNTMRSGGLIMGGGPTAGWSAANVYGGATGCSEGTTTGNASNVMNLILDSQQSTGQTSFGFLPRGSTSGCVSNSCEPIILLNRAGWTCK